jgi:carboxymethylenebutenolidase
MNDLTLDQQGMLAVWQRHTYAEFALKDVDAALATMTETPYVFLIPSGTGGRGLAAVREFYAGQFLPNIPPDFKLTSVSQTFGDDRIIEECVIRLTHTRQSIERIIS